MATPSTACIILIIAGTALSNPSNRTHTSCSLGGDLEETVPLFIPCGKELDRNGDLVQTIPVVVPVSSFMYERCGTRNRHWLRRGHRICRFQGTASTTPPSPDKHYSSGSQLSKSTTSTDESTSNPTTPSGTTATTHWLESTMPTVPGSTSSETTPATILRETSISQTTLYETSILSKMAETTSTEATHNTYPKTDSKPVTPLSIPSSLVTKAQAMPSLPITPTKSASTPMQATSFRPTTQTRTTSVETQAYNILDTTNEPTAQATDLSVVTSTHSPSVINQISATSATNKIPKTSDIIKTTTTTITTHTPTTLATTEIPTAGVTTQTLSTPTTTQTPTMSVTTQTPTTAATTQTPTTTATTQTPTTTATTQTTTTSVTTQPSTRSSTTSFSMNDCTTSLGYYKVFVTDHQDKRILWADLHGPNSLQFSVFLTLHGKPSDVTFDPVEQKLYWSDNDNKRIWRSRLTNDYIEEVTRQNNDDKPLGIVIAEQSRHLYFTYESKGWIHRVSLGDPDSEETFVDGLNKPKALAIDENNGFLYWSRHEGIDRKPLDGTGVIEEVIRMSTFSKMFGLTINTEGTRLFFCDENSKEGLYYDIGTSKAVRLIDSRESFVLRDVNLVDDSVLYWLQSGNKRILEMSNYQSNTDFTVRAENAFGNPQRIHIACINTVT